MGRSTSDLGPKCEELNVKDADAERYVSDQLLLIEKLRRDGHDTRIAEEALKRFEASLHMLREHRHLIVTTIEQIDKGLA